MGLSISFFYKDQNGGNQSRENKNIYFNSDTSEIQNTGISACPSEDKRDQTLEYITVYLLFYQNCNRAVFTDVQLNLDDSGTCYTYDSKGNLITSADNAGRKQALTYNNANDILTAQSSEDRENAQMNDTTYTYGDTKNPHKITKAVNQVSGTTAQAQYNAYGSQTYSTFYGGTGGLSSTTEKISSRTVYSSDGYRKSKTVDARGKETSYSYCAGSDSLIGLLTDPKGNTTSYAYNANNDRLTQTSMPKAGVNNTYEYDAAGNVSRIRNADYQEYNFTYDGFGRKTKAAVGTQTLITNHYAAKNGPLTSIRYGNAQTIQYVYDKDLRVTEKKYMANDETKYMYRYDAAGNLAGKSYTMTGEQEWYTYDAMNRLTELENSRGIRLRKTCNNMNLPTRVEYNLNGIKRQISHGYAAASGYQPSTTLLNNLRGVLYYYDSLDRMTRRQANLQNSQQLIESITYVAGSDGQNPTGKATTGLVGSHAVSLGSSEKYRFQYAYDANDSPCPE